MVLAVCASLCVITSKYKECELKPVTSNVIAFISCLDTPYMRSVN